MQALQSTGLREIMGEYQSKYRSLVVVLLLALLVAVVSAGVVIVYPDAASYSTSSK
jgi:hypothetical protein